MNKTFCLMLILIATFIACKKEDNIIISCGANNITKEELSTRVKILALDSIKNEDEVALFQLNKMLAIQWIAEKYGLAINDDLLQIETNRIDSTSLLPDKLKQIRGICNQNEKLYQKIFVKEGFLPRWLEKKYYWQNGIHTEKAKEASSYFSKALIDPSFFDADVAGVKVKQYWISSNAMALIGGKPIKETKDKVQQNDIKNQISEDIMKAINQKPKFDTRITQLFEALATLKPLQLFPKVVELDDAFWIVQLMEVTTTEKRIKVAAIPKTPFSLWLEKEMQNTPIIVHNKTLWEGMKKVVPMTDSIFKSATFMK